MANNISSSYDDLGRLFQNEPAYRLKQARRAIFVDLVSDWNEVTTLSKNMREYLNGDFSLHLNSELSTSKKDHSTKAIIKLSDDSVIETVLMRHIGKRNTICVSTQVGCPVGCAFCATGKLGFTRNLTSREMVDQVLFFARYLKSLPDPGKITNIVYMGMGEPFFNYDNVLESIHVLHDPEGFNLGGRNFSISTVGIISGIKKLASEELQINLAVSLHAPNDELRSKLIPYVKTFSIDEILTAVDSYIAETNRRVMFEYLLLSGVNDSPEHARELARIMKKKLYLVNLIPYNPTGKFRPSSRNAVGRFTTELIKLGVAVTERHRFGSDINAACGQLAGKKR